MSAALSPEDFPAFFEGVYGFEPFKWQARLVAEAAAQRAWPDLFDLPTASGKTAVIDAAVFLLALDVAEPVTERWAPRRIAMIVDRRLVVDQAAERAEQLGSRLASATSGVLACVRERLASLTAGEGEPLSVATLRGGVASDDTWIRRPDQPLVIASTVDQVGSRLLFQGYGVSRWMRPIHAGLLANDTLFVLDEVHLSQPFSETLRTIRARYQTAGNAKLPSRWHVTELSATPRGESVTGGWVFRLGKEDAGRSRPSRVLQRRIAASKATKLIRVKVSSKDPAKARRQLAEACVRHVRILCEQEHLLSLAIVVNRVDTARLAFEQLAESDDEVVLLTGRMRALERDPVVAALATRIASGRKRSADGRPLIVVATQCIEAGADFDFDGLVTECASLDALRQRFGRVDRTGNLAHMGTPSSSVLLGPSALVAPGADDPIYGNALAATWAWLGEQAIDDTVDFGISGLTPPEDGSLCAPADHAPHLLPATLDQWSETPLSRNQAVPEVAPWLHGSERSDTDIQIIWRADLTETLLTQAARASGKEQGGDTAGAGDALWTVRDLLSFCRPLSTESLAVPLPAARSWMQRAPTAVTDIADVEGRAMGTPGRAGADLRPFVVWSGNDSIVTTSLRWLRPGCTVVVPSTYGGLQTANFDDRTYGWWDPDPANTSPVTDLGDQAHRSHGRQYVARLFPANTPGAPQRLADVPVPFARGDDQTALGHLSSWLASDEGIRAIRGFPVRGRRIREFRAPVDGEVRSWYAVGALAAQKAQSAGKPRSEIPARDVDTDPETSSFTGEDGAELDNHLRGVGAIARAFAERCGLPGHLAADLELAAELHDVGKADERFQAWLRDGSPRLSNSPLLAKSPTPAFDRRAREAARRQSGYPPGTRHELLSLALISTSTDLAERAHDWDLVQHLVVSHHGWGRPFTPAAPDPDPQEVSVEAAETPLRAGTDHRLERADSGVAERFWVLTERYGWFRLAWLEMMLRLADHRQSEGQPGRFGGDR